MYANAKQMLKNDAHAPLKSRNKGRDKKLHGKISTAILFTCLAIVAIFAVIVYPFAQGRFDFRYERIHSFLQVIYAEKKDHIQTELAKGNREALAEWANQFLRFEYIVASAIYQPDGKVITRTKEWVTETLPDGKICQDLTPGTQFVTMETEGMPLAVYCTSLEEGGEILGFLALFYDLGELKRENTIAVAFFSALLLSILLLVSILLNYLLGKFVVKPVSMLNEAMNRVQKGSLGEQVSLSSDDEIGEMAKTFNAMSKNLLEQTLATNRAAEEKRSYAAQLEKAVVKMKTEIQERKKAENLLRRAEAKYRGIFENSFEGIFQITEDGKFISANPAMAEILGCEKPGELKTQKEITFFDRFVRNVDGYRFQKLLKDKGRAIRFNTQMSRKDGGRIWVSITAKQIKTKDGKIGYLEGTIVDITGEKEKEKAEREREAAEAANRTKSEFLATMSHEIRTPMNAILGFTELLEVKITDPQLKRYLAAVSASGKTLLGLINDILDLSKIEAGKFELQYRAVNPKEIFLDIEQLFSHKIQDAGLEFVADLHPDFPEGLVLDELRLRQVFLNLVGNAIKFTEKGEIRISGSAEKGKEDGKVNLVFSVSDTGIGIPDDQKQVIFEAFRQKDGQIAKKYGGTGLGLAISKRLVEMMGGAISLESEYGKGSTFSVVLHDVEVKPVEKTGDIHEGVCPEAISFQPAKILIADDIESNRELLKAYLECFDFVFAEAENGKEVLEMVTDFSPDLILMDIKMPVMDGYQAAGALKEDPALSSIPVIAVTASVMKEGEDAVFEAGCDGLIRKPLSRSQLINLLMQYLPHETLETPGRAEETGEEDTPENEEDFSKEKQEALFRVFQARLIPMFEKIQKTFIISDIQEFGIQAQETGNIHEWPRLVRWGRQIAALAQEFDMEALPKALGEFPGICEILDPENEFSQKTGES